MTVRSESDIELGGSTEQKSPRTFRLNILFACKSWVSSLFAKTERYEVRQTQIEDYREGYPRYSALIGAEKSFHICRRFSNLRARLLLLQQDKICLLEKHLEQIDRDEKAPLFLGSSRSDVNVERGAVIEGIQVALERYDNMVESNNKMLSYEIAKPRDVLSLQNWVSSTACLARDETAYLTQCEDLISVASPRDGMAEQLESWIEDIIVRFGRISCKLLSRDVSRDSYVYIFSRSKLARISRGIIACLVIAFLLAPVVVCNALSGLNSRLIVIAIATFLFVVLLSAMIKAKAVEMFVAGTTYATVLVVFVSGSSVITT
ncbi:uncharacterized protein LY89DRAFT_689877 [Mollisia scopiformis]|uniref:DUF6594 domain-containing protein n=1 Tax=Mollisia scopiformis TaxID=149040 RepID=A0A132BC49_MOLSC|nr:uncharacterized protein LY89DRAFT_689877 [Mollisia scopiformis]KUJ10002.1 hypothetical protein LY89DRAFT_689877 [Mollisia scopiformis]